jgi:hypothetical protein
VYPLELCGLFLSRPPSLNRPELVQLHLLKLQSVIQAVSSRFCLSCFQSSSKLSCFPLNELNGDQSSNQDSIFVFGNGRPVPKATVLVQQCDPVTISQPSSASVQTPIVHSVTAATLKIPVFTKQAVATKHNIIHDEEVSTTTKKHKKPDIDKSKKKSVDTAITTLAKVSSTCGGAATNAVNSVDLLLLEAGVCWAMFASFMSNHSDTALILQPLQVAQLKQIVKMNPKGAKVSGTKIELVERIVAMLKAA